MLSLPFLDEEKLAPQTPYPKAFWKHLGPQGSSPLTDKYFKVWASFRKHIRRNKARAPNTVELISEVSFPPCFNAWCSGLSVSPKWWAWPMTLARSSSLRRVSAQQGTWVFRHIGSILAQVWCGQQQQPQELQYLHGFLGRCWPPLHSLVE